MKKIALFLFGICSLCAMSINAANLSSSDQQQGSNTYQTVTCTTQAPCYTTTQATNQVPCNVPENCAPAPCNTPVNCTNTPVNCNPAPCTTTTNTCPTDTVCAPAPCAAPVQTAYCGGC